MTKQIKQLQQEKAKLAKELLSIIKRIYSLNYRICKLSAKLILMLTIITAKAEMSEGRKEYLGAYLQAANAITEISIKEWGSPEQALQHSETIRKRLLPVVKALLSKHSSNYITGEAKSEMYAQQSANQLHELIITFLTEKAEQE